MHIIAQIQHWYRAERQAILAVLKKERKYRLEITNITHLLADQHCYIWNQCVDTRNGSLADTPPVFQLNLALTLSETYQVPIYVKDICQAEDVNDLANTVLRLLAAAESDITATLARVSRPVT
jgi:hypothetical protein